MERICSFPRWSTRIGYLPAFCILLLVAAAGCKDTDGVKADTGSTKDGPAVGQDISVGKEAGQVDVGPDKAAGDLAAMDLPVADLQRDSEPKADLGPCQQNGQPCGGAKGKCCSALKCCSGTPVPPGQEYCAATCPKSDRNVKYGFKETSSKMVLEQLARLPITTWTYKNEPSSVRHIGPMAQDFKAVFGVGATERFISPLDAAGVALISIQALDRQVKQLSRDMRVLRRENRALRRSLRTTRRSSKSPARGQSGETPPKK